MVLSGGGSRQRQQESSRREATELEDLGTGGRGADPPSDPPAASPTSPPIAQRLGLTIAGGVVAYGLVTQLLIFLWLTVAAVIVTSASNALLQLGTFEPADLRAASLGAFAVNIVLLAVLIVAWLTRVVPHERPIDSFVLRRPIVWTTLFFLCSLGALTSFGWGREQWHLQEISAALILAAAYFFALLVVAWSIRVAAVIWVAIKGWALANSYRTGLVTASLLVLGAGGLHLRRSHWHEVPLAELRAQIDLSPLAESEGPFEAQQAALCVAASELSARSSLAALPGTCSTVLEPARDGAPSEGHTAQICFDELAEVTAELMKQARRHTRSYADAEDATSEAIFRTCTREPLPTPVLPYAMKVVRNHLAARYRRSHREVLCDPEEPPDPGEPAVEQREKEARFQVFYHCALDTLPGSAAALVRERTTSNASFRELGRRFGMSETQAKDIFHNAVKKLRTHRARWREYLGEYLSE